MEIPQLNLNEKSFEKITSLSLKVELYERIRLRAAKKFDDLIILIQVARESKRNEVLELFAEFSRTLSEEQHLIFKSLGLDTRTTVASEAAQVSAPTKINDQAESSSPKGKKKIIYRGQEKWV
ncbi:hypothetical protein OAP18_02465 [Gammaproteobacteria bacterium]|nr:hypothetical protein [Gammaproteobacteria bacterium]